MDSNTIALVQSSFSKVEPIAEQAAGLFYGRLFEIDPSLRALFRGDMEKQGQMLMQMIGVVVNSLTKLEAILPAVRNLGRRHAGYGVNEAHYDSVAGALLWTLEKGLGEDFTPEVKQAWTETYAILAGVMKDEARAVCDPEMTLV